MAAFFAECEWHANPQKWQCRNVYHSKNGKGD